ncbi:MAG: GTPase Era [Bacteroidales bacterium]|jgi:GTP-binding protein Era|nr:GTPase Era [Bacteroidales bacterium]MDI9576208.1 GTPase Era [Bacteroidota bacterium]MDD3756099.1 GTPase Era [Bacteroidales bacterium]HHW58822.1 GTPase Era [Bacteroidales bacterium]HOB78079.1 GTPase Era [Bacteroidales bacterium]
MHKAGFVSILGYPNVGKSTLVNTIIGEQLMPVSPKAQTTRQRVLGIYNDDDTQIIFSDLPGWIIKPQHELHKSMLQDIKSAFDDSDILIYLYDLSSNKENKELLDIFSDLSIPKIITLNKADLVNEEKILITENFLKEKFQNIDIIPISALNGYNVDLLIKTIKNYLPIHPPYYDKDILSDRYLRYFASEIIREQIYYLYKEEIPYETEVIINNFKEDQDPVYIEAEVWVMRESQKKIIIGKNGEMIKQLGINARLKLEKLLDKHVFLQLYVKVKPNWRNNKNILKSLGYNVK